MNIFNALTPHPKQFKAIHMDCRVSAFHLPEAEVEAEDSLPRGD